MLDHRFKARLVSLIQKLLLLTASFLFSAFAMEAAVLLLIGEQPRVPRHVVGGPFGLRINDPNVSYQHRTADVTVSFRINSKGMRADRDYTYEKPHGMRRIVTMGDSFTMGHEVNLNDTYSSVLERSLRKSGHTVEVLNTGVSGYGTAEECLYLEREAMKYHPDLVIIAFFGNDLVDNVRSNLFALRGKELEQIGQNYVPLGQLGDFLNRSIVLNFLSERSNAFAFAKERITELLKREAIKDNVKNLNNLMGKSSGGDSYEQRLAAALYERIYSDTRQARIPLIIMSIPFHGKEPETLIEAFPRGEIDLRRPGLYYLSGKDVLEPFLGTTQLYWERSDGHWTPFSQEKAGLALADLIVREKLLD